MAQVKWDASSKSFVPVKGRGKSKNMAARKVITETRAKSSNKASFSVPVKLENGTPNMTPSLVKAWAAEQTPKLNVKAVLDQNDKGVVTVKVTVL